MPAQRGSSVNRLSLVFPYRVAISNARLLALCDGRVTFRYKDSADDHKQQTMTLAAEEFLRRFVQHILPKSFVKIRHYGLLANAQRATPSPASAVPPFAVPRHPRSGAAEPRGCANRAGAATLLSKLWWYALGLPRTEPGGTAG